MTTDQARDRLHGVMSGAQVKLVDAMLQHNGALSREDLAAATDYSAGSGNFGNLISGLSTLDVLKKPQAGWVALSDWARQVLA